MPPDESSTILEPCPNCATLVDVTEAAPFSTLHCPICGSRMRVRRQINHFSLQKVLGDGGMGTVFEALDVNLQRNVAIKILNREYSRDQKNIAKLEAEARMTASINHPHVVKVYSVGRDHGQLYLAMELVGGGTLDRLMNLQMRVAEIQVLDVGIQVAAGLRAALKLGLIHRDVKPGNILFADAHTAKIVDFGLALLMEDEARARGEIWGTPYYIAPEKLDNAPEDFRSDIYSLGATLFHAIAGRPPFEAASASIVALKHVKNTAITLQSFAPDISDETAYVINRMLHKDPASRHASYDELIEHLSYARARLLERTAARHDPTNAPVVQATARPAAFSNAITLVLGITTLATAGWVYLQRDTLFSSPHAPAIAHSPTTSLPDQPAWQTDYARAMQAVQLRQRDDAIPALQRVINAPGVPQPTLAWARILHGMLLLIEGRNAESAVVFSPLRTITLPPGPDQEVLTRFFQSAGTLLGTEQPVPAASLPSIGAPRLDACAGLLIGLKNWQLGKFDEAGPLLQHFASQPPPEDPAWLRHFQPVAAAFAADFGIFQTLRPSVTAAISPAARAASLQEVREASTRLSQPGPLPDQFNAWERRLASALNSSEKENQSREVRRATDAALAEDTAWNALQVQIARAGLEFAPEKTLKELEKTSFQSPACESGRANAIQQLQWVAAFKADLIRSLNTGRFRNPITLRSGAVLRDTVQSADTNTVRLVSAFGSLPVGWKDVSPQTVRDMALLLSPVSSQSREGARARWHLGAYYIGAGLEARGRALLIEATQIDPTWTEKLPVYFSGPAS